MTPRIYAATTYAESFRVRLLRTNNVPDDETVRAFIAHIQDEAARDALMALKGRLLSEGDIRQRTIPNLSSDAYDGFLSLIDAALK